MPRFHFHVDDGVEQTDRDGIDLLDVDAARLAAVQLAGALLGEAGPRLWERGRWRLWVTDETDSTVLDLDLKVNASPPGAA